VRDAREWQALCDVIGLPDFGKRNDLQSLDGRRKIEPQIEALIEAWTVSRDRWETAAALQARGVPAAAVEDVADLVDGDPGARDAFERVAHPAGIDILLQHEPITWDGERLPIQRAPFFGEHTTQIFNDLLNIDEDALADLVASGVVQ
jgi:formyl-CoA transferase